jgi:radical SAM-linked protein
VDGTVDLARKILAEGRRVGGRRRRPQVTLSASSFVPKPETPFQWVGMDRVENLLRKQERIAARAGRGVRFRHHGCETSFLEAVFSRGDRSLCDVLESAWRHGARFDGWDEQFDMEAWRRAFRDANLDPEPFAHRDLDPESRLPWQVTDSRINRKWLALELRRALGEGTLSVCGPSDCHGCAPFARECVKGVVAETTDRPLDAGRPVLSTPAAPGPGLPAGAERIPPLPGGGSPPGERSGPSAPVPVYRWRGRFSKTGRLRFLGHLDLARLLLRGLRRAGLPLVYSQGFNPKPKVAFGPALAVGISSDGEVLDFETRERLDPVVLPDRINAALPEGVRFDAVREIRGAVPSLGDAVRAARYRIQLSAPDVAASLVERFRRRKRVTVERTTKKGGTRLFDLTEELLELEPAGDRALRMTLALHAGGASVRPEEAVREILGGDGVEYHLVRETLLVDWRGRLVDPLLAASASHAAAPGNHR